ncbi:sugar transferase [Shouchella patagoniensis]|uniref:sugar transferase n=1 Tax=Shouchella patagoniensis TaxID=228576 RepID=UPI001FE24E9A|nr:sugar transferase [Shouchella patagoniensis]
MLILKKTIDYFGSTVLVIVLSPFLLLIAILIKCESKGPIFFRQNRLGYKGETFKIFKFRTMQQGTEKAGTGIFTNENDPRITKIGKFLRKTSLDELPQLLNILKGEMSFIGPRPPVPYHPYNYEDYTTKQKKRFLVKPGITGLAQITGRNNLSWDERIEYDVKYVDNLSFKEDIRIVLKTIQSVVFKENIYRG